MGEGDVRFQKNIRSWFLFKESSAVRVGGKVVVEHSGERV